MSDVLTAALVGGLIGTFFGAFSKFVWERWLPDWLTWRRTQRVEREQELSRLRAPAIRCFAELHSRLKEIVETQASNYHYVVSIGEGDYFINSTAYEVGCVFAWEEIMRQRMATLDYAALNAHLEQLTAAFFSGRPGFQFFRLQQVEIGERLSTLNDGGDCRCVSLSSFLDQTDQPDPARCIRILRARVVHLLDHPVDEINRVARIDDALTRCLRFLDPKRRWLGDVALTPINVSSTIERWTERGTISPDQARMLLAERQQ